MTIRRVRGQIPDAAMMAKRTDLPPLELDPENEGVVLPLDVIQAMDEYWDGWQRRYEDGLRERMTHTTRNVSEDPAEIREELRAKLAPRFN